jgi:hypothetical protein
MQPSCRSCFLGRGNAPLFEGISNAANVAAVSSLAQTGAECLVCPVAIITFIAFLVGALLSQRFSVWSLLPMTVLAPLCTAVVGVGGGARLVSVLLAMFLVWVALPLGYFAGTFAQGSWISLRAKFVSRRCRHRNAAAGDQLRQAAGIIEATPGAAKSEPRDHAEVDAVALGDRG